MSTIAVRHTRKRGCGWRKPGGLYLVCDGEPAPCGLFPIALDRCPTCGGGIKPTRSWTWIDPRAIIGSRGCSFETGCRSCGSAFGDRAGLLWIGGEFYERTEHFLEEARRMGISRRISAIPRDFANDSGEGGSPWLPWVLLAHRECIRVPCPKCEGRGSYLSGLGGWGPKCDTCSGSGLADWKPGIFAAFRPTRIEYVVKGDETEEQLQKLVERGATPVRDVRVGEGDLPGVSQAD